MIRMLGHLTLSQRSLRLSSFLLCFFFFPLFVIYFYHSILYLTYPIFCLHYSTVGSLQSVFGLIYCIIHYILTLYFISSRSLLNISCLFSVLVSRLFICNSTLFSRFWIIFIIIILNSLSGRFPIYSSLVWFGLVGIYPVPLPAEYFSAFSSCLDYCVWGGLSVFCQFVIPLYCGVSSLWVELDGCQGLSRLPVEGSLCQCSGGWSWISSLWSAMKCPVVSFEISVGLV